jgi:hypothetical protein
MQVAIIVTRTMTTMATAVMDTDHTGHMRRPMDMERIHTGHMRVHTVSGGGDVIPSGQQVQPTTKDCGICK